MRNYLILALLVFASCNQANNTKVPENDTAAQTAKVDTVKPTDNALTFINAYVDNCNKMKEAVGVVDWVNANTLTTAGFKAALKKIMDDAYKTDPDNGLGADPIFNAQYYPDSGFALDTFDQKTNYVVVKGKNEPNFKLTIKMVSENNNWLVDGCGMINLPSNKKNTK